MALGKKQRSLLKEALRTIPATRIQTSMCDMDSLLTSMDIDTFLTMEGPGYLTKHQRRVIEEVIFKGFSEKDVAADLGISQQAVSYALSAGVTKIYNHLTDPKNKPKGPIFTPEAIAKLIDAYNEGQGTKDIACLLDLKVSTVRNKIRQLRERGVLTSELRKGPTTQRSPRDSS